MNTSRIMLLDDEPSVLSAIQRALRHEPLSITATVLLGDLWLLKISGALRSADTEHLLNDGIKHAETLTDIRHRLNAINDYRTIDYHDTRRILDLGLKSPPPTKTT